MEQMAKAIEREKEGKPCPMYFTKPLLSLGIQSIKALKNE